MLIVVRIGSQLPIPGINGEFFSNWFSENASGASDFLMRLLAVLLRTCQYSPLNITPYITSSIIIQLLTIAIPKFEKLHKDGEEGRKKLTAITRYLTVALAVLESLASP